MEETRPSANCVLFVSSWKPPPAASLQRAQELADLAGVELRVLRVVSERQLSGRLAHSSDSALVRFVETARETARSCIEVLAERYSDERLTLAIGSLPDNAALYASELNARLLVVPGGELRGRDVTALGRTTGLPVLVIRPTQRRTRSILAATDLSRPDYPVLRSARALATLRGSSIVALHALRRRRSAATLGAQLQAASRALGLDGSVLLPQDDAVSAILSEAAKRAVDVIVVGTHARTRLGRTVRASVAARLIDRARRSVWVQPILG